MRVWAKTAVALLLCHYSFCAFFLLARPPERPGGWLDKLEEARLDEQPGMTIITSSSEPILYLAERPLYQWNEWHGGESLWVKVLVTLNLPSVAVCQAFAFSLAFSEKLPVRQQTWLTAGVFLLTSTGQWLLVAGLIAELRRRRQYYLPPKQ
jgi:hypothetical protein